MRLRTTALPTLLLTTLFLAACGGGGGDDDGVASLGGKANTDDESTATTLSEEEQEEALLDWAACMRSEGIDMPDPQIDANGRTGIMIGGRADVDDEGDGATPGEPPDFEEFEAAQEECGEPPFFGGELTEEDRKEMEERALAFAECMRDEGIEDFPDPDFSDRGPGAGPGVGERRFESEDGEPADGPMIAVAGPFGQFEMDDPDEIAAFEACQEEGGFGPPGGPGAPGSVGVTAERSTADT